jgi:hypothetical protein
VATTAAALFTNTRRLAYKAPLLRVFLGLVAYGLITLAIYLWQAQTSSQKWHPESRQA